MLESRMPLSVQRAVRCSSKYWPLALGGVSKQFFVLRFHRFFEKRLHSHVAAGLLHVLRTFRRISNFILGTREGYKTSL